MDMERVLKSLALLTLIGSAGCTADESAPQASVGAPAGFSGTGGLAPGLAGAPAPVATAGISGGVAGTAPAAPSGGAPAGQQQTMGVPCDVAAVISENCTTCHSNPAKFSAPMPLMAHSDFQATAKTDPTKKVYQVTPARINATDITQRMPPASGTTIAAPGLKAFNDWLAGGAVAVSPSCAITVKGSTPPTGETGTGTTPAPGTGMSATGEVRSGGASDKPQEYNDPELKCYEFRAHAPGSKTAPFMVGNTPDMYTNFTFMPPWQGMMYARSFRVLTGNPDIIHHWLFYKNNSPGPDGDVSGSIGAHPNGELLHGWAPGGSDMYLDPDVGIEVPGSVSYVLETHHNNGTPGPMPDDAGIEVCVTPKAPTHVASLSWLGTDNINGASASGTCDPTSTVPIHIIGGSPHMHTKGRHMKAELTRANGTKEMLHDQPFDFEYQKSYNVRTVLMPGDSIKTTCTYSAPARFGEGTNDEMCYFFTLYYPKLSLTNGNPVANLIHGPNTCLQ
jgi:hypothetical protein